MCKKEIKAFLAGMAFPAALLSIVYTVSYLLKFPPVLEYPFQFVPIWVPWIFGLTNIIIVKFDKELPQVKKATKYWATGITLGFILATFGIVVVEVPIIIFGWFGVEQLYAYLFVPLVYGLIWRYIVWPLNKMMDIKE